MCIFVSCVVCLLLFPKAIDWQDCQAASTEIVFIFLCQLFLLPDNFEYLSHLNTLIVDHVVCTGALSAEKAFGSTI